MNKNNIDMADLCIKSNKINEGIDIYKKEINNCNNGSEKSILYHQLGLKLKEIGDSNNSIINFLEGYEQNPNNIENIYELTRIFRERGKNKTSLLFYNLGIEKLEKNKNIREYIFDYEYSIIAAYNGIKTIGKQIICILNNCKENFMIKNLFTNMKYYKNILNSVRDIDLSFTIKYDVKENLLIKFVSSSSSIIKDDDNYIMNIRLVNYMINNNGGYYDCGDQLITINKYMKLNNDFSILDEKIINCSYDNKRFIGIEDIRLYKDKEKNNIIFNGCGGHSDGRIGIIFGDYIINNITNNLEGKELKSSFSNNYCEKNWVLVDYEKEIHLIYEWFPLKICKINKEDKKIYLYKTIELPNIFKYIRGSTNSSEYKNEDNFIEKWFIVHLVSEEHPRHYYHMFIIFDENMYLLRYSEPFKFQNECIEYCLGLVVERERIICTYSAWDRTTHISIYDRKYIESLFL